MTTLNSSASSRRHGGFRTRWLLAAATLLSAGTAGAAPAGLPQLANVQPLALHYGVNTFPAFTGDGTGAIVVMVHRENGNAHSTDALLIATDGKPAAPGAPGVPQQVEREEAAGASSGLFTIAPFDGELEIRALRLARATVEGRPAMLMLQAARRIDDVPTLATPSRVDLTVWRLDGPSDAIGRTPYRFVLAGRATTNRTYCNATTALNKELGVPFPDGWDNEDTPDGCPPPATRARGASALQLVRELDVTSFPNSLGPRHLPPGTTFAAAGYGVVESFDDGWVQVRPTDASWQFSLLVLDDAPGRKRVCIVDQSMTGGTYRSQETIEVQPDGHGRWRATSASAAAQICPP